jgi:hypothetical protein
MLWLVIAFLGFFFPNGIYIYWLATRFDTIGQAAHNELAAGFLVEMLIATILVAYRFHVSPLGKIRVHWFVLLSMIGGLGFGIPAFYWLNKQIPKKKPEKARKKAALRLNRLDPQASI